MRTYTCDRCSKTVVNPSNWITVDVSPLHSTRFVLDRVFDEQELHYCTECSEIIQKILTQGDTDVRNQDLSKT